ILPTRDSLILAAPTSNQQSSSSQSSTLNWDELTGIYVTKTSKFTNPSTRPTSYKDRYGMRKIDDGSAHIGRCFLLPSFAHYSALYEPVSSRTGNRAVGGGDGSHHQYSLSESIYVSTNKQ